MMNRRNFLRMAAASGAASALRYPFSAYGQSDEIRFGCPVPLSGAFAANGKFADLGMKLALDNTASFSAGTGLHRDRHRRQAGNRGAQGAGGHRSRRAPHFFAGGILSSEALAMGKEVDKAGGVFMTTGGRRRDHRQGLQPRHLPLVACRPTAPSSRRCAR